MNPIFPITGYPKYRYDATRAAFAELIEATFCNMRTSPAYPAPTKIVETFAGLGGQTAILQAAFPGVFHFASEKDRECYNLLRNVAMAGDEGMLSYSCGEYDRKKVPFEIDQNTLLVVDGAYSLAQHDEYVPYHHEEAGWLIICEQARTRLHLHTKTYGLPVDLRGPALYKEYLLKVAERHRRPLMAYRTTKYSPSYVLLGQVER